MDLLKEVLNNEVYPALGCTEPVSCAYAAALAAAHLGEEVQQLELVVDPGTFKNGAAVAVPFTQGQKGNLIAAALGAVMACPDRKLELLRDVNPEHLRRAQDLCAAGRCSMACLETQREFRVEVRVQGGEHAVTAVLAGGHTTVERIERDGRSVMPISPGGAAAGARAYRRVLGDTRLGDLLALPDRLDAETSDFLERGVRMNLEMAEQGVAVRRTAYQLLRMKESGFVTDDIFFRVKLKVSSAVDARMAGAEQPVMTSGGSGNQGIVAALTPYLVGWQMNVDEQRMLRSIAVAHLVNAYVKCFQGELSVVCGCAMGAGIAAAVAIVYQQVGVEMGKISLAVNSVIGDLGGLICDGAKPGCSMKCVTAVDSAIRSGLMALEDYGLTDDGMVGQTAEQSIRNLGQVTIEGMVQVDPVLLKILGHKGKAESGPGPHAPA